jgi:hypothetical protein
MSSCTWQPTRRHRHLWRRPWAPDCTPAASRADVVVGFSKCRGSGRASMPSSSPWASSAAVSSCSPAATPPSYSASVVEVSRTPAAPRFAVVVFSAGAGLHAGRPELHNCGLSAVRAEVTGLGTSSVRHGAACMYACVCWVERWRENAREREKERDSTVILTIRIHRCQLHGLLLLLLIDRCACVCV